MFKDIGHPFAEGKPVYDVTFENVQAGERTSHLFRLANVHNAPVVGTSDLSELALGWCTYGVGDHMAHYHVNASVPKTLIQYLIRYVARTNQLGPEVSAVLHDVLDTPISARAGPGQERGRAGAEHRSDGRALRAAGLHISTTSCASAICRPRSRSWPGAPGATARVGNWPDIPDRPPQPVRDRRHQEVARRVRAALLPVRQYKRSAIPNAPKVGSGGSLSPRSDYRAPSDSEATVWLADVERIPEQAG